MATMTIESGNHFPLIESNDEALVAAAKRDLAAFAPLYQRYFDPVYGYCRRMLRDPELAADATSQTFAKALQGIARYRARSFRGWLFTIAHNVIVDQIRRQPSRVSLDAVGDIEDRDPSPETRLLHAESQRAVDASLSRLTRDQRAVVELRLAGLRGREIADVLGLSEGAVKALQFRAYSRLRVLMKPEAS